MRLALVVGAVCAVLAPLVAYGYVRSTTSVGTPLAWSGVCPHLNLNVTVNSEFSDDLARPALERAVTNWTAPLEDCSGLDFTLLAGTTSNAAVEYDDSNTLLWRLPSFCDQPGNELVDVCAAPNVIAVTTIYYIDKPGAENDGEIVEADVVMNGVHFEFSNDGAPNKIDLESVMTHEFGHFLGLDHTCHTNQGAAPPIDDTGNEVPSCFPTSNLSDDILDATMYTYIEPGVTIMRTPLESELSGLCTTYAGHSGECTSGVGGCGCRSSGGTAPIEAGVLLLALILWRKMT